MIGRKGWLRRTGRRRDELFIIDKDLVLLKSALSSDVG